MMRHDFANQDRFWVSVFALYFVAHILLRTVMSGALGLDEAETLLQGQALSLGYGPQLPLYAWLQWATFQVTGSTIFGLSILKNTLLFLVVFTIYLTLRSEYSPKASGLASLSLLLLPQISWEAQRDLTHSVLVNLTSVMTFALVWQLSRQRRVSHYVLLGVIIACGALSKYNYGVVLISIVLALILFNDTRRVLISPWLLVSLFIAALFIWEPALWILNHPDIAFSNARKLGMIENSSRVISALKGLLSLVLASLSFIAPLFLISLGLWARYRKKGVEVQPTKISQFMLSIMLVAITITAIFILASSSTNIKDRWLQPILIFSGPFAFLWLYPRLSDIGVRRYVQICSVIAAVIVVMMVPYSLSGRSYRSAPFHEVAAEIKAIIPDGSTLLATSWISGNLLYAEPGLRVIAIEGHAANVKADYIVWNADEAPRRQVDQTQMKIIEAPYRFNKGETLRIAIARIID